ncbi:PLDc N-terminal domain-containing protein [Thiothrix eikelboomii]|uniref:PLDc N-terminal domain-containing protein n=1 Tax=Thiothrix eikelboomii TaxID=92487 RepID=UPI003BAF7D62
MGIEVGGLLGLIHLIVAIWAIIKVAQSSAGGLSKFLWILFILFFPLIGLLVWFFAGPKGS